MQVKQEVGNWTEVPGARSREESAKHPMADRYAHDKVLTAGDTQAGLVQGIFDIASDSKQHEISWDAIRGERYLWEKLILIKIRETMSYSKTF